MILTSNLSIKVVSSNINYWKKTRPTVSIGDIVSVSVDELPPKSNIMIECVCDLCKRNYRQRKYRNLDVCGYCLTSTRLKGNTLGQSNKKYVCPDLGQLASLVEQGEGKQHIARTFGVGILVVNRWLKENNLTIRKYQGRVFFKTDDEKQKFTEQIRVLAEEQSKTISEICSELGLTRQIVSDVVRTNKICVTNKFMIWQDQYETIKANIQIYVKENKTKTLNEIANEHQLSIEQLKKAFREHDINPKIHAYNKSKGELECRNFIRSLGFHCDSYRFDKTYEIDCYVSSMNFGVEYCGEYWHQYDVHKKNKTYHKDKTEFFLGKGIRLMTIYENEWKNKKDLLKSMIKTRLGIVETKIFARKCVVTKITDKKLADEFHMFNHISGKTTSSLNYGLYHEGKLVSVLSMIRSRFDKNYEYEISRFSSLRDHVVVGGLSRLFKAFCEDANPVSCMTYADMRFGEGKSYAKIGFIPEGTTAPNYHYFHSKVGVMESRMKYQKKKLQTMPEYDVTKTEFQIMNDAGYYILFDCGNRKYGWRKK